MKKDIKNKNHWYDGLFYDLFIAPNQDRLFSKIADIIEPNSTILDVGCGTGRFSFFIASKCKLVTGMDLSEKNINRAKLNLRKNPEKKINFLHTDIEDIIEKKLKYDYVIMTYVIHEINENERIKLLNNIAEVADKIIIGDYLVPKSKSFWTLLNEMVEFFAGSEHYRNYKNYVNNGGLRFLAEKAGLKIKEEIKNNPSSSHLVLMEHFSPQNLS